MSIPYRIVRPVLFRLPAERVHHATEALLRHALRPRGVRAAVRRRYARADPSLRTHLWGIEFPNPIGLAAGFDKAGTAFNALAALGFGHIEIGTITALAQPGNPAPRLFRLPADRALLNRFGFNNPGAAAVGEHLGGSVIEPILGINIGKSKATPLEQAVDDYLASLEHLHRFARYLVVNVSSPNTPGLRELQDARPLRELLGMLGRRATELAHAARATPPPLLLKIAPDLEDSQLDQVIDIAMEEGIGGIIATNTTVSRAGLRTSAARLAALGPGGISGAPLRARADAMSRHIYRRTDGTVPIIGVGGIFNADDALARIRAGASLVQLYTGFIYGGPATARQINHGLAERLRATGAACLGDVVGSDAS